MMRITWATGLLVAGVVPAVFGQQGDALDETLSLVGMKRADLGWRPKGWWLRFPGDIPYKLRAFDDLLDSPLETVTYTRLLAHAAREHLDPAQLDERLERGCTNLYQAVHMLGTNPKYGGLRGYTVNLRGADTPLDRAILAVHHAAGRTTRPFTFGDELPYPRLEEDLADRIKVIPEDVRPILGRLVTGVVDAHHWTDIAFRNVEAGKRMIVAERLNVGAEQVDAYDYCPEFDDVARTLDQASLWYASEKCVQAVDDARLALAKVKDVPPFAFDWRTPWGWIRVRGTGNDETDGRDALLIVDLGGDDRYTGGVAASTANRAIGLLLDCSGNDAYESSVPAQGAGLTGIGILLDAGGDDRYHARHYAQGVGQFGFGLCADLGGKDRYFLEYSGQGCGYFGVGLMFDCDGDDEYTLYADGQGLGGVAGVGVLADRRGDDSYIAVRDAKITGRPSYHSPDEDISVSNAQGCAIGRRGDGADGHSWAGGLGALLDIEGRDKYLSGNWSQGTAYWFGTGLLYDGTGDDEYRGVCWSQAAGAHFCVGALIDEGGDDLHISESAGSSRNSLAFGHDFAVALLVNLGGNDTYEVKEDGLAFSLNRSVAALIDVGGDDTYRGKTGNRPGMAKADDKFDAGDAERPTPTFYFADASSVGLFLDVGGKDAYWSGHENDTRWLDDDASPNWRTRNFSVGVDRADGMVRFVPIPQKAPTAHHSGLGTSSQDRPNP